jgi:subtilisin family serine protease
MLFAQEVDLDKIGPNLWESYQSNPNQIFSFYVIMDSKYDIHELHRKLKKANSSLQERSSVVNKNLKEFADEKQVSIRSYFSNNITEDLIYHKPHWIINCVYAEAKWTIVEELSARSDVSLIQLAGGLEADETVELGAAPVEVMNTEYSLFKINAHKMWELGYTGYGVTCLTADTGVDPNHPSIISQQRASVADQFDHAFYHNNNSEYSFDCGDHGTHVTGTILGLDRLNDDTIGVAFNGQWMGAAVLCGIGTADNVDAFEWAMDPDNNPNTVDDMPAFINNSWYDPTIDDACENIYVDMLTAVEAVGIGVVFSAGNAGPESSSMTNPKNLNMGLVNTFSVGALNSSANDIADFSSRGPSQCFSTDASLLIKPEVSAPGQSIRSCVPGGGYDLKSGTSMSAPHVAGALMLLKEAFPQLSGEDLKLALYYTAVDLGIEGEDNTFGMGIIDVFAAYEYLIDQGYEAVDPNVEQDIFVFGLESSSAYCASDIPASFGIENGGTQSIEGVQVSVAFGDSQFTIDLDTLVLEPGERYFMVLDSVSNELGVNYLSVEVNLLDASLDERPLNNRIVTRVDNKPLFPSSFEVQNTDLCLGGTASITGTMGDNQDGYFIWYSDEELINEIGTGNVLNLSLEEAVTNVYAESIVSYTAGSKIEQAYVAYPDQAGKGLVIRPSQDVYFNEFTVNVEEAGSVFFRIYEDDEVVKSILKNFSGGVETVFVGLDLREDQFYKIEYFNGSAKLLSHDYDLPFANNSGLVDVVFAVDQNLSTWDKYFFFYDMNFEYIPECNVQRVELITSNQSSLEGLSFELVQEEFNSVIEFPTVSPIPQIDGAYSSLLWDFGDGTTSTELEPSHTYGEPGEYLITLMVLDEEGCESVYSRLVKVESYPTDVSERFEEGFNVYPNPFNSLITLEKPNLKAIKVLNTAGQLILEMNNLNVDRLEFDLAKIPVGIYFVNVFDGAEWQTRKIVKQ